jgi:HJR/Mrr/RecB family endonuclease
METDEKFEKPIKPKLDEFDLNEQKIKALREFESQCDKKSNLYLGVTFGLFSALGIILILTTETKYGFIVLVLIASALISWGIVPFLFKTINKSEIKDFIFEKTKDATITKIEKSNNSYTSAMGVYKGKNDLYERVLRRATWQYWLSLTPTDFEDAVGDLFLDKGYVVWTTSATGDHGVDLYLEKDGKNFVVQCKTYKKVLGPNSVRDLYGAMTAQGADEAFLAAPGGFSAATKEFCRNKPIKLLDIDDLTKMTYDYESYTPYWLENAKSMDDVIKGINKNILGGKRYRGRRY